MQFGTLPLPAVPGMATQFMGRDAATTTRLRPSAFARQFRHTEARGDGILQRFHDLPGKQASELPGFRCRPGKVRVRHQHDEFLSAVARHDIRQPEWRLEKRNQICEHPVARALPVFCPACADRKG